MTNLQPIDFGKNQYCGPAVLSSLLGISTDEAASIFSRITGRKDIRGVHYTEMKLALKSLGWEMNEVAFTPGSSMFFLFQTIYSQEGLYILGVDRHVVAIEVRDKKIYICDNATKTPINAAASARLGQKVMVLFKLDKTKIPPMEMSKFIHKHVIPQGLGF